MAIYINPLDNFKTYSIHYTLAVSDNSESFRNLMETGGSNNYLNSILSVSAPGGNVSVGNSSAYLLIDTRRFSQYSVDECTIHSVSGGMANPQNPAEVTLGVGLQIKDTTGMTFYNTLVHILVEKLQVSNQAAFYLLNIFFVGQRDDGLTEIISSSASVLQAIQLDWSMNTSGSIYNMQFLEMESVAPKDTTVNLNYLGQVKSISTAALSISPKNTIGAACSILEETLNRQALSYFQRIRADAKKETSENKLVQYIINIPDDWKNFKVDTFAKSKNDEALHVSKIEKVTAAKRKLDTFTPKKPGQKVAGFNNANNDWQVDDYIQLSFSTDIAITDAVKIILESASEFLNLLTTSEQDKTAPLETYTITTNVTSDDQTHLVYVNVYPKKIARITNQTGEVAIGGSNNNASNVVPNLIEFDYLFTGKNNDIKSLDLKFNNTSLLLIDTAISVGKNALAEKATAQSSGVKQAENVNTKKTPIFLNNLRNKDYVGTPIASADQKKGFANNYNEDKTTEESEAQIQLKQKYKLIYATLNFQSNLKVNLVIRGNPNIIKKMIDRKERGGLPPHSLNINTSDFAIANTDTFSNLNKELNVARSHYYTGFYKPKLDGIDKVLTNDDDALVNSVDYTLRPFLIKINIKAPNVDSAGNFLDDGMYTSDFFYNGTYQILNIETTLTGDEFIHDLLLIPNMADTAQQDMKTP